MAGFALILDLTLPKLIFFSLKSCFITKKGSLSEPLGFVRNLKDKTTTTTKNKIVQKPVNTHGSLAFPRRQFYIFSYNLHRLLLSSGQDFTQKGNIC